MANASRLCRHASSCSAASSASCSRARHSCWLRSASAPLSAPGALPLRLEPGAAGGQGLLGDLAGDLGVVDAAVSGVLVGGGDRPADVARGARVLGRAADRAVAPDGETGRELGGHAGDASLPCVEQRLAAVGHGAGGLGHRGLGPRDLGQQPLDLARGHHDRLRRGDGGLAPTTLGDQRQQAVVTLLGLGVPCREALGRGRQRAYAAVLPGQLGPALPVPAAHPGQLLLALEQGPRLLLPGHGGGVGGVELGHADRVRVGGGLAGVALLALVGPQQASSRGEARAGCLGEPVGLDPHLERTVVQHDDRGRPTSGPHGRVAPAGLRLVGVEAHERRGGTAHLLDREHELPCLVGVRAGPLVRGVGGLLLLLRGCRRRSSVGAHPRDVRGDASVVDRLLQRGDVPVVGQRGPGRLRDPGEQTGDRVVRLPRPCPQLQPVLDEPPLDTCEPVGVEDLLEQGAPGVGVGLEEVGEPSLR